MSETANVTAGVAQPEAHLGSPPSKENLKVLKRKIDEAIDAKASALIESIVKSD